MKLLTLVLAALMLLSVACNKEDDDDDDVVADIPEKDMLSSDWDYGGHILNYSMGDLSGTTFSSTLTTPGGEVCTCDTEINGTQSSGTIESINCARTDVLGTVYSCVPWAYTAATTYTNNDGVLRICRNGGGGCTVHTFE
jgi:hypothetical protein